MDAAVDNITSLENVSELLLGLADSTAGIFFALESITGLTQDGSAVQGGSECLGAVSAAFSSQIGGSSTGLSPTRRRLLLLDETLADFSDNLTDHLVHADVNSTMLNSLVMDIASNLNSSLPGADNLTDALIQFKLSLNETSTAEILRLVEDLSTFLNYSNTELVPLPEYLNRTSTSDDILVENTLNINPLQDLPNVDLSLDGVNLTSATTLLNVINNHLNQTMVLEQVSALGLFDCVSHLEKLFTTQSNLLNTNSLNAIQAEMNAFFNSYGTFLNATFVPTSLRGSREDLTCLTALKSFVEVLANLSQLLTFTTNGDFAEDVLTLKAKVLSVLPEHKHESIGSCDWPLKNSIWRLPGNGIINCENSYKNNSNFGHVNPESLLENIDTGQQMLLQRLQRSIADVAASLLQTEVLDQCAVGNLLDSADLCGNTTNIVFADALKVLTNTISSTTDLVQSSVASLTQTLDTTRNSSLSFSQFQLAHDFQQMNKNMTNLITGLRKTGKLLKKINLALIGNVETMVPNLYSELDEFKLIPLDIQDLSTLGFWSSVTNGTNFNDSLQDFMSGLSESLELVGGNVTILTSLLSETLQGLERHLDSFLQSTQVDDNFYRCVESVCLQRFRHEPVWVGFPVFPRKGGVTERVLFELLAES